jgi:ABC-type multidrug transport system ATPase subunit
MDKKITKHQMLRETMYVMFKDNHLPYLDMEDFLIMWQSLADQWNIRIDDDKWEEFIEEVNSVASNRQNVFNEIFDKYFI